MKMGHKPMSLQ